MYPETDNRADFKPQVTPSRAEVEAVKENVSVGITDDEVTVLGRFSPLRDENVIAEESFMLERIVRNLDQNGFLGMRYQVGDDVDCLRIFILNRRWKSAGNG